MLNPKWVYSEFVGLVPNLPVPPVLVPYRAGSGNACMRLISSSFFIEVLKKFRSQIFFFSSLKQDFPLFATIQTSLAATTLRYFGLDGTQIYFAQSHSFILDRHCINGFWHIDIWRDQNSIPRFRDHARLAKKYLSIENSPYGKEREIQIGTT